MDNQRFPKPYPTATDAARRLIILKHVVLAALSAPPRPLLPRLQSTWSPGDHLHFKRKAESQRDEYWGYLHEIGLWEYTTPKERELASTTILTMTDRQQIEASWRIEAAQTLMWALGLILELPAWHQQADHDLIGTHPVLPPAEFIRSAELRDVDDIRRARTAAEFWHWRGRARQIIERDEVLQPTATLIAENTLPNDSIIRISANRAAGAGTIPSCIDDDLPINGQAYRDVDNETWHRVMSITVERHFALNWLCGFAENNDWDETPTDT